MGAWETNLCKSCWGVTGSTEVCSCTHQWTEVLLMTPVTWGGRCTRRWCNMYEDQEVEINTGGPKNICRWTHHFLDSVLSLPNPDKHSWGNANTGGLTGVPATVAFVLCGLRCPTWWRCGQRPLRKAASEQDPTKGSLYCLEGTKG